VSDKRYFILKANAIWIDSTQRWAFALDNNTNQMIQITKLYYYWGGGKSYSEEKKAGLECYVQKASTDDLIENYQEFSALPKSMDDIDHIDIIKGIKGYTPKGERVSLNTQRDFEEGEYYCLEKGNSALKIYEMVNIKEGLFFAFRSEKESVLSLIMEGWIYETKELPESGSEDDKGRGDI